VCGFIFFCSFVVSGILLNPRRNDNLFIETFLKHLSRTGRRFACMNALDFANDVPATVESPVNQFVF
jgi:hypothetical protein